MDAFTLGALNPLSGAGLPVTLPGALSTMPTLGGAANRCCNSGAGPSALGIPSMEPLMQMVMMQQALTMMLLRLILELLSGRPGGGGGSAGAFPGSSRGYAGVGGYSGAGGGSGTGRARGGTLDTGPVQPGTQAMLEHANRMVGLHEDRDTAAIQAVTGRSGINPSTTPWCAAWAMNLLEQHGVLNLDGLSNRNYVPTIKSWAQNKGIWGENGRYQPKPGDAIVFDWDHDGTPDHIGLVERVEGGKVYTIEGNASDQVLKRSYALGSSQIDGYLRT
ncbi:MAG TPA: CHAP domain-containing protein [Candidatus Nitrosotenuis sp.]|nr:CHAP domain-containing protein [Candidatus Nitrosotenuis sp.]